MAFSLLNKTRYEQSFKVVEQSVIDPQELALYKPQCLCVHGTWGKSLKFFSKEGYVNYVPCNPASSVEVGKYYDTKDVVIQTLERNGEVIDKAMLKCDLNL